MTSTTTDLTAGTLEAAERAVRAIPSSKADEKTFLTALLAAGAVQADLDVWVAVRGGGAPLWSLGMRLNAANAFWPSGMALRDAIGWALIQDQDVPVSHSRVGEWDAVTPHGWAYEAAGVGLAEASTGTFTAAELHLMAALRGITVLAIPPVPGDGSPW